MTRCVSSALLVSLALVEEHGPKIRQVLKIEKTNKHLLDVLLTIYFPKLTNACNAYYEGKGKELVDIFGPQMLKEIDIRIATGIMEILKQKD